MKKGPRYIFLTRGAVAVVDWDDYDRLNQWKWHLRGSGYAGRNEKTVDKTISMQTQIFGRIGVADGSFVDHINGDRLDNRRINLRVATSSQNHANSGNRRNRKYKGVHKPRKNSRSWHAKIGLDGRQIHLGSYATEEEAALAYNEAAVKYYGEFARLNVVKV